MAITDFNKLKKIDVSSVTDTPTISRAQPFKITSGDDSTTGTGEVVLDWTNIADKSDIAVYDENDNLLDYHFEEFDATTETAVIWVYRNWDRDGSTQAQIAYGDGPNDQSVIKETVFDNETVSDKETGLVAGWLLNESPAEHNDTIEDATGNNNDGTLDTGDDGEDKSTDGMVDGALEFDGTDDYVNADVYIPLFENSLSAWLYLHHETYDETRNVALESTPDWYQAVIEIRANQHLTTVYRNENNNTTWVEAPNPFPLQEWVFVTIVRTPTSIRVYQNGVEVAAHTNIEFYDHGDEYAVNIGTYRDADGRWFKGKIDEVRIRSSALSTDDITATYDATKESPDFFSQQAGEETVTFPDKLARITSNKKLKIPGELIEEDGKPVRFMENGKNIKTPELIEGDVFRIDDNSITVTEFIEGEVL